MKNLVSMVGTEIMSTEDAYYWHIVGTLLEKAKFTENVGHAMASVHAIYNLPNSGNAAIMNLKSFVKDCCDDYVTHLDDGRFLEDLEESFKMAKKLYGVKVVLF